MTTATLPDVKKMHEATTAAVEEAFRGFDDILGARDDEIATLKKKLETGNAPKIGTVFGINGNRTGKNGITRTPDDRRYYQPGQFPARPDAAFLKAIEQELTISWKLPPAEVIAGKHDARIISWHMAAKAGLPKLKKGRRHRTVPWHEPKSEIDARLFTGDQHRLHVLHVAKLLHDNGLTDTFVVCPNYTMGPPKSGAGFDSAWLPNVDQAPADSLMISGDLYNNPSGGGALNSPYSDPHEDLDVLAAAAREHGFEHVAVLELGAPRRTHDPSGVKRVEYFQNFVDALGDYDDLIFDVVDLWEGIGKWDQKFTLPNEWAFAAKLLSSSPQTRV